MKIFQILNGFCHWDATRKFPTLESLAGRFPPTDIFVEAPDHVFEGWGYADGEFVQPPLPEPSEWTDEETGEPYHWVYDTDTGTFYIADENGEPVDNSELGKAIAALKDATDALTILGVEQEEIDA